MTRRHLAWGLALLLLAGLAPAALAAEGEAHEQGPQMSEEEMAAWMKAMTPGEHHEHMKMFEGTWTAQVSIWMAPDGPPQVSGGTSVNRLILGGRYLQQDYTGSFMGQTITGMGLAGYDNAAGEHFSTWVDSMGTGIMVERGSCGDGGKTMEARGEFVDPITGHELTSRTVLKVESPDRHVFTMYMSSPDGSEFKTMEIVYTRKAS